MAENSTNVKERLLFSLLLTGAVREDEDLCNDLSNWLDTRCDQYVMCLFSFSDIWPLPFGGTSEFPETLVFELVEGMKHISEETFEEHYQVYTLRYKNDVICILQLHGPAQMQDILDAAALAVDIMHDNFDCNVSAFVSAPYKELLKSNLSFQTLIERRQIHTFMKESSKTVLCSSEPTADDREFEKELSQLEDELMQSIRTRKFEKAYELAERYLSVRFQGEGPGTRTRDFSFHMERFIYELQMAFYNMLPPLSQKCLNALRLEARFTDFDSRTDLLNQLKCTFDEIRSLEQEPSSLPWLNKLVEYVNLHYADCNMNVSSVGYQLGKHPAYISRIFRQEIGCGLYEYIQKLRISRAKQLMGTSATLTEVAELSGFGSVSSMNRAFQKYEKRRPRQITEE